MSDLFPVAGAHLYIGAARANPSSDVAASDFASESWVDIDGWETCGAFGDARALISTQLINRGRDVKQKGTANAGQMQNVFAINSTDAGQTALIAAANGTSNYAFKIQWNDPPSVSTATVTMTIAAPGVITWTAHGLAVNDQVKFTTTGALPTGLTAGTTYFVKTVASVDTFTVSATAGGSAITTSGTQSGVHTGTTVPVGTINYFVALVMNASQAGGGPNTVRNLNSTLEINSNVVTVAPAN